MERKRSHYLRHGMMFTNMEITREEKLATEFVSKIKEEALTLGNAEEVLDIARAMLRECKIV